jgi:hypothetical protein
MNEEQEGATTLIDNIEPVLKFISGGIESPSTEVRFFRSRR